MDKILIVDDVAMNREILEDMLSGSYETIQASGGKQAIEELEKATTRFSLVLLDLVMPDVDGFAVLSFMKEKGYINKTPVIVISNETTKEAEDKSLELGASDFVRKPFDETTVNRRVKNIVDLYNYKSSLEQKVDEQTATLKKQYQQLLQLADRVRQNNAKIIDVLGMAVEYRDVESGDHIQRVKTYTEILGMEAMRLYPEYGLTEKRVKEIAAASVLHDLGKIAIPDAILLKPGRLTDEEFEYMKSHAARGAELISKIKGAWTEDFGELCYDICRHHHEKYDGRGYPDGLVGEDIPISAQLVSIADVYDALVSERVYKSGYDVEQAFHMIIGGECGMFSPKLMECFRNVKDKFEKVQKELVPQENKLRTK